MRWAQYTVLGILLAMTAVGASFGLCERLSSAGPWTFVYTWIGLQVLQVVATVCACAVATTPAGCKRLGAIGVSAVATVLPLVTLALFLTVFVIGGSSYVAQLAGDAGYELWALWAGVWPLLFFGNPVAWLVAVVAAIFPPYPPRQWASIAARLLAVLVAAMACHATFTYFPDA